MRRWRVVVVAASVAAVWGAGTAAGAGAAPAVRAAVPAAGLWGTAIEVPGLAALGSVQAEVTSLSCASAGNCAAVGEYRRDRAHGGGWRQFVVSEVRGRWSKAAEVRGHAARGGTVLSVSCASAGNCTAGGDDGWVVSERHGVWGTATAVPGLAALNKSPFAVIAVNSVSCASAGNCAAGGYYYSDRRENISQGFVAVERHGRWGTAIEVPGLGALNKGGDAEVTSVSCGAAGNCAAGGPYTDTTSGLRGFVAVEKNGAWGTAIQVGSVRKTV